MDGTSTECDTCGRPRTKSGRRTTFTYDALSRLSSERRADGSTVQYSYTVTGQLAQVLDANGVTRLAYDEQDRLTEIVRPDGLALRYGYDAEGHRTRLEAPSGTTTYEYDELGRLERIVDAQGDATTLGYDANGNPSSRLQPNGIGTTYARDLRDRLTQIESRNSGGGLLSRYAYTLDAAGYRTRLEEASGRTVAWQYDALYRLTNETIEAPGQPAQSEGFGYDAVGNRILRSSTSGLEQSTYDANDRLLSDGAGAEYAYDANGNLVLEVDATGATAFSYDAKDRLIEVSGPSVGVVEHRYDYAGDRIETRVDGAATKYLVDANRSLSQVIEERTASNALVASYVHDDAGNVLERRDAASSATSYYLHDAQLSVRQIANGGGAISDSYDYSAFGRTLAASGPTPNAYRYGGQREDPRTQLYHLRARWMDPRVGRFASTDPALGIARDPGTFQPYAYAHNAPISRFDRTGRMTMSEAVMTTAIVGTLTTVALPQLSLWRDQPEIRPPLGDSYLAVQGIPTPREHWQIRSRIEETEQMGDTFWWWSSPAEKLAAGRWFMTNSLPGEAWDFKKNNRKQYEKYGNWHWGVMANAFGIPMQVSLQGAGLFQYLRSLTPPAPEGEGIPVIWFPFGDQAPDTNLISRGWMAYEAGYRGPIAAPPSMNQG